MIYPIVLYGDPVLKKGAEDIPHGEDIKELVADMFDTMYAASGVGLAAPQIGKSIRLFVVDDRPMMEEDEEGIKKAFINPEILEEDGEPWAFEEGCLSIPGIREDVKRNAIVKIKYYDEDWNEHIEEFDDIHARVIQHEYDHIEGILFTDYITSFKKRLIKGKLANISKGKVDADYRVKVPVKR
ncbi:peptide deformylase [Marinoscillum furvescens]|uniref:Peptide deformylase n=1 Tax=Marinoscillum furvescens DSM 4134 TaxID=1122208 RepID=A0A3D9L352_MARFU|nr:peptide deformylase [Marinoscillum furvescens]RED99569.1 peptide deformylase [Marinoscillum furvescens DSM 4134]